MVPFLDQFLPLKVFQGHSLLKRENHPFSKVKTFIQNYTHTVPTLVWISALNIYRTWHFEPAHKIDTVLFQTISLWINNKYIQWVQTKLVHMTLGNTSVLCTSFVCAHCIFNDKLPNTGSTSNGQFRTRPTRQGGRAWYPPDPLASCKQLRGIYRENIFHLRKNICPLGKKICVILRETLYKTNVFCILNWILCHPIFPIFKYIQCFQAFWSLFITMDWWW